MPATWRLVLLFLAAFGAFGFAARGHVENTDAEITLHAARAWWLRGDPGLVRGDRKELLAPGEPTWPAEQAIAGLIDPPGGGAGQYGRVGVNGKAYIWFPIGHQALFVPAVVIGEALAVKFPAPERKFEAERGAAYGQFSCSRFVASFLSPLCASMSFVLLAWIASALGASRREALLVAVVTAFTTQMGPGSNETMSNTPGAMFLILAVAGVVGYTTRRCGPGALLVAGLASGAAILVRYPQVVVLAPFWLWAASAAMHRRRLFDLAWLVVGGLPGFALLLGANQLRFGVWGETGYSGSAGFGVFPFHWGLPSILVSPGKGLLWFSPLLWLVLAAFLRRSTWTLGTTVALIALLAQTALFSTVTYWAAGQCWGVRYLTAPIALLSVFVLVRSRPWRCCPRSFVAVCVVGLIVQLGGWLTPYVGQQRIALVAGEAIHGSQINLDDNVNWSPRLSPVHSHWTYAVVSAIGHITPADASRGIRDCFGVDVPPPVTMPVLETGFRHFWWRGLEYHWPEFPGARVAAIWATVTALLAALAALAWLPRGRSAPVGSDPDDDREFRAAPAGSP